MDCEAAVPAGFEEALRDIGVELEGFKAEAVDLPAKIKKSFEELGV